MFVDYNDEVIHFFVESLIIMNNWIPVHAVWEDNNLVDIFVVFSLFILVIIDLLYDRIRFVNNH